MASVSSKVNPLLSTLPHMLTWPRFQFRTICSGRLGFAPYSSTSASPSPSLSAVDSESPVAGVKVLETFKEEFEIGSRQISLETGKIARFANGAVVLAMEETKVLSTIASGKSDGVRDFLPLTVDYQEKQFAQGLIPNTFMRREGAPRERELLCGRLIDRPIRPLFPPGFYHEVQVMASVLSSDGKQDPDVMAANATSAALMLSDVPWGGPIGVIRIGRVCGQFIVNPSTDELSLSDLNLVYACTRDKTLMIDVHSQEIPEKDLEAALRLAHPEAVKYLEPQIRLAAKAGKQKKEYRLSMVSDQTKEKIWKLAEAPIQAIFTNPTYGKFERGEALDRITQDVKQVLEEECDEDGLKVLSKMVDTVRKEVIRRRIITEGIRVDGRRLDEVRPLYCEAGNLPILHGSSLFSRGDTQVLCTVTLGAPGQAQRLDSVVGPPSKRFMLHYSFPPFCINEVGKRVGLNRREVGHGTLAEKALLGVVPPEDALQYTVRINSEVMASDGSTSMASVCGGSMALMDAGVQIREHVAGISIGLVTETDSETGEIKDYRILTDILGLEDHLGDMDFKIAGTRNGVTAIQLDIKPAGIPLDIICECLEPALKGRLQILDHMEREISGPRAQDNQKSSRLVILKYNNDAIRRLIGPMGAVKRKIEEATGGRILVGDGTLTIVAKNETVLEKVKEKIDEIIGREIEIGGIYKGTVTSIKEYGAFVEFNAGQQGLLHISELSNEHVNRVSDVVSVGQQLLLMCIGQDNRGNIKLSLKATLLGTVFKSDNAVEELKAPAQKKRNAWATVNQLLMQPEKQDHLSEDQPLDHVTREFSSATPAILIRSVTECDEEDRSCDANLSCRSSHGSKSENNLRKFSDCSVESASSDCGTSSVSSKTIKSEKSCMNIQSDDGKNKDEGYSPDSTFLQNSLNDMEMKPEAKMTAKMTAKKLKIGMELTTKVLQIRARGLVLDLGGGIKGMLRFEDDFKRDFEVGEELRVKCCSFNSKGIPVMSLVSDQWE